MARLNIYLAVFVTAFLIGVSAHARYASNKQARIDARHNAELVFLAEQQAKAVADIDKKHTRELTDAENKVNQLRADVERGAKRLLVATSCVPDTDATASVDHGASAVLDRAARQDYFDLRRRAERAERQITALQDYIKNVCLQ